MAKTIKIESRTLEFIEAYNKLKGEGKIKSNAVLASDIGVGGKTGISNIIAKRNNIQPHAWEAFKKKFHIETMNRGTHLSEPLTFPCFMQNHLRQVALVDDHIAVRAFELMDEWDIHFKCFSMALPMALTWAGDRLLPISFQPSSVGCRSAS